MLWQLNCYLSVCTSILSLIHSHFIFTLYFPRVCVIFPVLFYKAWFTPVCPPWSPMVRSPGRCTTTKRTVSAPASHWSSKRSHILNRMVCWALTCWPTCSARVSKCVVGCWLFYCCLCCYCCCVVSCCFILYIYCYIIVCCTVEMRNSVPWFNTFLNLAHVPMLSSLPLFLTLLFFHFSIHNRYVSRPRPACALESEASSEARRRRFFFYLLFSCIFFTFLFLAIIFFFCMRFMEFSLLSNIGAVVVAARSIVQFVYPAQYILCCFFVSFFFKSTWCVCFFSL